MTIQSARHGWLARATATAPEIMPRAVEWLAMAAVTALATALDFWGLSASGYGNEYYAAAVRSMAQSPRAFFFAGFDPGGFITVDKPPLGFWVQVASVKLLGYSGFSLLLPEALAGVLAVLVLWRVTRRVFGAPAGVLAALALAITPVSVVANRDNILEPALVLTLLLAAWALERALERGALGWLLLCAALVGLGFNIKMLEAYLVVPAFALAYLLCAPRRKRTRVAHLALAFALMVGVSLAWVVAVDAVPASQRPYVGSTVSDSELDLALGYNGLGRLSGAARDPRFTRPERPIGADALVAPTPNDIPAPARSQPPAHAPAYLNPRGAPGPLRLAQPALGSQVSWLAPLALIGLSLGLWSGGGARPRWALWRAPGARGLALWGAWLGTCAASFSFAHTINAYYTAVLAPAIAALAGMGAVHLWRAYRLAWREQPGASGWRGYALPVSVALTGVEQAYLTQAAPDWRPWLASALIASSLGLALLLAALRLWRDTRAARIRRGGWGASALASFALAALLLAPVMWSGASLTWGNEGGWPAAGPQYAQAQPEHHPLVDTALTRYLMAHRGRSRYLVATVDAYLASPLIIATGEPVMILGGFGGHDPILTPGALARLVARGDVRLFLVSSANLTAAQRVALFGAVGASAGARRIYTGTTVAPTHYTNALTRWVSGHCAAIPPPQWNSAGYAAYRPGAWQLFACR